MHPHVTYNVMLAVPPAPWEKVPSYVKHVHQATPCSGMSVSAIKIAKHSTSTLQSAKHVHPATISTSTSLKQLRTMDNSITRVSHPSVQHAHLPTAHSAPPKPHAKHATKDSIGCPQSLEAPVKPVQQTVSNAIPVESACPANLHCKYHQYS